MENLETENERNHAIDVALKQCDEIAELRQWKIDKNNELAVLRVENVEQQDKIKSLESEKEALQKRVRELEQVIIEFLNCEDVREKDLTIESLQEEVERLKATIDNVKEICSEPLGNFVDIKRILEAINP
jgi:intracellular sulfur oxidation DsrE/DsrF family protein